MTCTISDLIKEIPLYQTLYGDNIRFFDLHSNYHEYPSLEKKDVARGFPNNWMTSKFKDALVKKDLEYNASSGTTSERMQIVRKPKWWADENRNTYQHDARLAQINPDTQKKAVLTTAICSNTVCFASIPSYEERIMGMTLYLNISPDPNNWQKHDIERITNEINIYQPDILDVDPIYLALFLRLKEKYGLQEKLHQPKIIIYTYEYVTSYSKKFCDQFFPGVPTIIFYGSTETGYNLFETDGGRFKHVQDRCYIDFEHLERDIYALKITSWKNEYMPLINYKINDLVRISDENSKPTFERSGQALIVEQLCGRLFDATSGANGNLVTVGDIETQLSSLQNDILFYQLKFYSPTLCHFKYVTRHDEPLTEQATRSLQERMLELYGKQIDLKFMLEKSISPEISGKFAVVKKG